MPICVYGFGSSDDSHVLMHSPVALLAVRSLVGLRACGHLHPDAPGSFPCPGMCGHPSSVTGHGAILEFLFLSSHIHWPPPVSAPPADAGVRAFSLSSLCPSEFHHPPSPSWTCKSLILLPVPSLVFLQSILSIATSRTS